MTTAQLVTQTGAPAPETVTSSRLRARWLGRVRFHDAHAVQRALFRNTTDSYLLLLEHHPVYTVGLRGALERHPAHLHGGDRSTVR